MLESTYRGLVMGAALAASLGCGATTHGAGEPPTASGVPFAQGGSRLSAWFLEAGASRIFDSFYDRQLGSDCTFMPSGEAASYACFPSAPGDVLYLDGNCSQAALRFHANSSLTPPSWVSSETGTPGSKRVGYHVAERLPELELEQAQPSEPVVFALTDAGCVRTELRNRKDLPSLYRLEPQDDEVFVSAIAVRARLSDDFSLQRFQAEDGAELTFGVLDRNGQPCQPQTDGVCVPTPFSVLRAGPGPGLFLDASCATRAFDPAAEGIAGAPTLGVDRTSGRTHAFELKPAATFAKLERLDPTTGARVFDADGQLTYTCQPDARFTAWAPGPERTANLASTAQLEVRFDDLRFIQQRAPGPSAEPLTAFEPGGVFVNQQGLHCQARATQSHEIYCPVADPEGLGRDLQLPNFSRVAR